MSDTVRYLLTVLATLSICSCATVEPRTSTITNTISVPVPVPCIKAADIPARPKPTPIDLDRATHDQVDAANAADLASLDGYADIVEPLLKQCAGPAP